MADRLRDRAFWEAPNTSPLRQSETFLDPAPLPEDQRPAEFTESQDLLRGFYSTTRSLEAGTLHRRSDEAEAEGRLEDAVRLRQQAHQYDAAAGKLRPRVASFQDVENVDDAIDFIQSGLGQVAPTMLPPLAAGIGGAVAGAAVAGPLGIGPGLAAGLGGASAASIPAFQMEAGEQAASQQADPYIRENTTAEERLHEQNIKGAQNAALESLFPAVFGGRIVGRSARRIAGEALKKSPLRRTLAVGRETGIESGTEFTQTLTGQASSARLNPNRDTSHDYVEQIDSIILGALGGSSVSLGTTIPGYLVEQAGQRLGQEADTGARNLGRAVGELELRLLREQAQRGEQVGIDVPLRPSLMIPELDPGKVGEERTESIKFEKIALEYQRAVTAFGEDSPEARAVVEKGDNFLKLRNPEYAELERNILTQEEAVAGQPDVVRLSKATREPTPENPDINMMPNQPVAMFPSTGSRGAAKFRRRHVLTGRDPVKAKAAVKRQLLQWKREGFISASGMDSAQPKPLGQWLQEQNASAEEVQAEADTMLRDIDTRLKGNNSAANEASLITQKAAIEAAKTYDDLYSQLNDYSVIQFPPSEVKGRFTPQDADQQRRSLETVTADMSKAPEGLTSAQRKAWQKKETMKNRADLEKNEVIRVKLRVGGHKDGRKIVKKDVMEHALNFFREELKSFPDGPRREEAALLMGVFSDPRVTALLHKGKEITQDDINLEDPVHRAALKLDRPDRGYAFGKKPQDPAFSRDPGDIADFDRIEEMGESAVDHPNKREQDEIAKMERQRRLAEERLAEARPNSFAAHQAEKDINRLTGQLARRYDPATGAALIDQTRVPITEENPVIEGAPRITNFYTGVHRRTRRPKALPPIGSGAPRTESPLTVPRGTRDLMPRRPEAPPAQDVPRETSSQLESWQEGLPEHTIDRNLENPDGTKRLATVRDGKPVVNPVKSTKEFFSYFLGQVEGPGSQQKGKVLGAMVKAGWPLPKIRGLITTPGLANRFLVLHEQDHIDHNDRARYFDWEDQVEQVTGERPKTNFLTDDKIKIEVRATKNALDQLQSEVDGGLKASLQVSNNKAFRQGGRQWSSAKKGTISASETYEGLCIACANKSVNKLRAAGLPAVKFSFRHQLPGTETFTPHFAALTKGADGKYYIVDDPQKNLYTYKGDGKIQIKKNKFDPKFIELTAENLEKHYGITEAEAEEQYTGLSAAMQEALKGDFLDNYFAERSMTPGRGYDGLIDSFKEDLDRDIKPSKQVKNERVANQIIFARLAKNLNKHGFQIVRDQNSDEYYVVDKDGKRVEVDSNEALKTALNDSMPEDKQYATREEAMKDPNVAKAVDAATKWLIRAFGPEILENMGWMLAREAPGQPMAGYYDTINDFIMLAADSVDPLSFAFHEGMHKFVKTLGKEGNPQVYDRLVKAATSAHVMRQMEKLLADYPQAIDQIRTDPEEAVAYAFQFYAASRMPGGPAFNIQPTLRETFAKIVETIKRMLGLMTHAKASQEIFDALFEGRVNRDGIEPLRKYQERAFKEYAKDVMGGIRRSVPRALSSPIIQLERQQNANGEPIQAFQKLARALHSQPLKGGPSGLVYRQYQGDGQYRNRWHKVLTDNNVTKEEMKSALLNFQSMKPPRNQFERQLRHFLDRMHTYQTTGPNRTQRLGALDEETGRREWEDIPYVENFFPRIWSIENILANEVEFREVMAKHGELTDEQITNFIEMLQATNGLEAGSELQQYNAEFSPYNQAINARVFTFIDQSNASEFAKFQEQDMAKVMDRYIRQAVHRREHSRTFGSTGDGIRKLFDEAKLEGATPEQIAYTKKVVQGIEGRLGTDKVSDLAREAMVTSMSITNFAVLAMATLSSMVDPLGVWVRTGSLKSATKTFQAGFKQILNDARKTKTSDQELTEYLGIIEEDMVQDMLNNMERGIYMNEKLRKLNKFFFKSIGLEPWTRGTRVGAMRASIEYLKKYADDPKRMEELGLEPGQIEEFEDRIKIKPEEFKTGEEITDADIEKARQVQNAMFRMVDESILRPSAATRPLWASDMRFRLLGHLKSYVFTFHNQILRQVMTRAGNAENRAQAALAFMPLLSYVPVMIAADMVRDAISGDDKDRDLDEIGYRALQRSAILGMGTFFMDIEDELDYGGFPTNTVLGPVVDSTLNLGRAALNPDASILNAGAKLLPYNALWRKWGDE